MMSTTFDSEKFKTQLLAAIDTDTGGHNFDLLIITKLLLANDDVKELFAKQNVDIDKLQKGLEIELNQRHQSNQRRKESHEQDDSNAFEANKHHAKHSNEKYEQAHELINNATLRASLEGRELQAKDILKEAVISMAQIPSSLQSIMAHAQGRNDEKPVHTFDILKINMLELFPELKQGNAKNTDKAIQKGAERTGRFLSGVISEIIENQPELAQQIMNALGGDKSKHPRIG